MKRENIRPIPKYIVARIKKLDKQAFPAPQGRTRFYSYLTTNAGELVKVTVAVRHYRKEWYCKQCAVHGIHSDKCFVKDMVFHYVGGYSVGWYAEGITKHPSWYEGEEWGWSEDTMFDPFAPVVNKEYATKRREYKYSAAVLYADEDILQYLRLYEQYPQTEYLVKLGLSRYATSKQILQKCEKDKKFRKWLALHREELMRDFYYITTIFQAYSKGWKLKEVQAYERAKKSFCRDSGLQPIRDMLGGDYRAYFEYIGKQQISNRDYLDYLTACNFLGLDMSEAKNRFPHDFKHWHDVRIDEYHTAKALKDAEERKELYNKFLKVSEKYEALQYDKKSAFVVVIARSPAELIKEGEELHHCVGKMGYDQKFIREESLVFFVRSREHIDKPFVTVEYSLKNKKVLQCYAKGNQKPNEDVLYYVNQVWLPFANRTLKKIAV